ncbi:hypothetical protein LJC72_11500 [Bacteroides sp. OttesenSCG-928-D19]|nr:hypothetical protein [Bacteroides sp. OttesenSCG-928-D19]
MAPPPRTEGLEASSMVGLFSCISIVNRGVGSGGEDFFAIKGAGYDLAGVPGAHANRCASAHGANGGGADAGVPSGGDDGDVIDIVAATSSGNPPAASFLTNPPGISPANPPTNPPPFGHLPLTKGGIHAG